jgi:hypothetical protein
MISPTVNFSAQTLSQKPILRLEEHVGRNLTDALWLSADAFYDVGGERRIDGIDADNMANTLRVGVGMGLRLWRGADLGLNYARVVAKPAGEPDSQTVCFTFKPCKLAAEVFTRQADDQHA